MRILLAMIDDDVRWLLSIAITQDYNRIGKPIGTTVLCFGTHANAINLFS